MGGPEENVSPPKTFLDLLVQLKGPKSYDQRMAEHEASIRERVLFYIDREDSPFGRRIEFLRGWISQEKSKLEKEKQEGARREEELRAEAYRLKRSGSDDESAMMLVGAMLNDSSAMDLVKPLEALERLDEELRIISEVPADRLNESDSVRRMLDAIRIPNQGSSLPTILTQRGDLRVSVPEDALAAFQRDNPNYDRNVFVMMPFSGERPLIRVWDELRKALEAHGLRALRADQKTYGQSRQLWDNLITYMYGSKYGIAVLEQETADEFNPNVALEYGFMRALGKNVLLLKEKRFRRIRADILGTVWIEFDVTDVRGSIHGAVRSWAGDIR